MSPDVSANAKVTVGIPTHNRAEWLRECVASVLAQSYGDFQLLISDNASDDETGAVVASFDDSRIDYARSESNVGMIGNFNRVIELARGEFLIVLPDDDILYPEYLSTAVGLLESHRSVGVLYTGYTLIDADSRVLQRAPLAIAEPVSFERGRDYLERVMGSSLGAICWTSALFRTKAIASADGMRADEQPFADIPLFMRIALDWDFLSLAEPLVGLRVHEGSETAAAAGTLVGETYDTRRWPRIFFDHRIRFLDELQQQGIETQRYRQLAKRSLRTESVRRLAAYAGTGAPWMETSSDLAQLVRADARTLLDLATWKLIAAQLGGRYAKRLTQQSVARLKHRGSHT